MRKSTNRKWRYYRSLSFASIKSHEHGRLDLLEHGLKKPHHVHKNVALDDYSVQSLKEIPSKIINEGQQRHKAWSQKRRINTKGACTIKTWEIQNESEDRT